MSPSGIKLAVASEIRGRVTGDARDAILAEVQEQVSILNSTFSWKESDRATAKRATHALSDLAKNSKSSVPLSRSPSINQHLQAPPVTEEDLVQKLLLFELEVEKVSAFALGFLAAVVAPLKASESSHCFSLFSFLFQFPFVFVWSDSCESSNGIKVLNAKNTMEKAKVRYLYISGTISAYESLTLRGYDVVAVVLEDHGLLNEGRIMSYMRNKLPILVLPPVPKDYASRSRCNSYGTKRQFKVKTVARIVESDAGKVICREVERIKPAAGSVGKYCFHHCKAAPVVIVPEKDAGDASIL
ncbi:hypothetical protein Ahy_A07g034858 [Arachis hypogaea]|uniref:Uncharacterized protein n=1 Tax=Arachis hypogaea TaxID=3818 RepID=A0A445CCV7_ARAHY|nr:hypothetical protein Ahy_A07g034858 [Arachis hypogaea]